MHITLQPLREEALRAGFIAMQERLPEHYSFGAFREAFSSWDVKALCDGERAVGMFITKADELHVAVIPEVRGRWLSRRLINEGFAPVLEKYGIARTSVAPGNERGLDFVKRIRAGFANLTFDPITALVIGGTALASSAIGSSASKSAASTQAAAADRATDTQLQIFDKQNAQQEPYRQAGYRALDTISALSPQFAHQFDANDLKTNLAPNYDFQLQQGLGATKNAANMQTGLLSGNTLKGINDYAQNYAGNAYQQAFSNYTTNQNNIFNRLSTVAGFGSGANQQSAQVAGALAPGIAQTQVGSGAAQAAGTVGAANAITGGLNNAMGWYTLSNMGAGAI